ncbi:MAG: hypothetical protein F4Z54_09960 [Acidimicrobiaceae bacterium]|nr:hypothetical protein [Acidimicrobiaceae bacterium]MYI14492.1 hypothetical protein [Acidimicrobiaceae bacterium]
MVARLWKDLPVTSVGIVGAGRAATLHAEAVRAASGVTLAGVSASSPDSPRAAALAGALDCPVLTPAELARVCDVAVIATPPASRVEVAAALAESRRLRAMLVESPAATTLGGVAELAAALPDHPIMAAVNLLHAPVVRRMLDAVTVMEPHHLELRLGVPDPARGPDSGRAFGGGVTLDPGAGFWPVVTAAMGSAIESVAVSRADVVDGLDRAALIVLRSVAGRTARADLRWDARVAEAALEAADSAHVARVDIWPVPVAEIDGALVGSPGDSSHPLAALGFVAQIERLARVAHGGARPWPDLDAGSLSLTVAAAAAVSVRRGGVAVNVREVPGDASPFEILSA